MQIKRIITLIISILLLLSSMSVVSWAADPITCCTDEEWELLRQVNKWRISQSLLPMSTFAPLQSAAVLRASELKDDVSEIRPSGKQDITVLGDYNIPFVYACENRSGGYNLPSEIIGAWLANARSNAKLANSVYVHAGAAFNREPDNAYGVTTSLLMLSGCTNNSVALADYDGVRIHIDAGTTIDALNRVVVVNCSLHGTSYIPLADEMCSSYNTYGVGEQTIKINYGEKSLPVDICVDFSDVKPGMWYYDFVMDAYKDKLFSGVSQTQFAPAGTMTRAMFVTVLGKMAGIDKNEYTSATFSDVSAGTWYAPYVVWASQCGIVSGTGGGNFSPDNKVTRQELCLMLSKYASAAQITMPQRNTEVVFGDNSLIAPWAATAVRSCQMAGVIAGDTDGNFNPINGATRAECATIVVRFNELFS